MSNLRSQLLGFRLQQRGAVILMTVTLLLLIVTLTTLYTGRSQTFEHRIIVNNQNHKMALISAEAGIQKQIAELRVNAQLIAPSVSETLDNKSTIVLNVNNKSTPSVLGTRNIVTLSSKGTSPDGLVSITLTEQFLIHPLLFNLPIAPLIVEQGVLMPSEFEIVANSNGLGAGHSLSIWSDKDVFMSTTSRTCELNAFLVGTCASNFISNHLTQSTDIQQHSSTFPTNIWGYLFNAPMTEIEHLHLHADKALTDCNSLNSFSRGLIWVKGLCSVSLGERIGSQSAPLILIVQDGDLLFAKDVLMYGMLFSYRSPTAISNPTVAMSSGAQVTGALISNHQFDQIGDQLRVVYDQTVLENLMTQNELQRVARIPGSWRDH
ncbi:hypothetical protein [Paraglaciecola sp.]|uniref:hypothetical protein n=1 Tax=Paraglaciecola sp. TaxID=1920173 RepID=UPI003EFA6D22